ncbi:Potassium channel subfamily K member 18 [Aphelenchoides besseyi]|nr:Potassium channel subfamily K member 18 [Aphelenchoides besseyi]KAI6198979.1 Potassium channel subfamily K member 18 [Aphelenchoides besseyi]
MRRSIAVVEMFFNLLSRGYDRYHVSHFIMGLIVVIYTLFGAVCFCLLEQQNELNVLRERAERQNISKQMARARLVQDLSYYFLRDIKVSALLSSNMTKLLDEYDAEMIANYPIKDNRHSLNPRWSLWSGFYYAYSVYTTIGYGDLTTRTPFGRLFTIIYALFGIPLFITLLNMWGGALFNLMHILWKKYMVRSARYIRTRAIRSKQLQAEEEYDESSLGPSEAVSQTTIRSEIEQPKLPLKLAFFAITIYVLFSTVVFMFFQSWSFNIALYFSSVSLLTIGLGDVTVEHRVAVLNFALIIIGLSIVSMSIQVIQIHIEAVFARIIRSIDNDFKNKLIAEKRKVSNATSMCEKVDRKQSATVISIPVPTLKQQEEFNKQSSQSLANATAEELDAVNRYADKMKYTDRLLVKLMSSHQKKLLNERFLERTRMRSVGIQTDERKTSSSAQTERVRRLDSLIPFSPRFQLTESVSDETSSDEDVPSSSLTPQAKSGSNLKSSQPAKIQRKRGLSRKKLYIYNCSD